MSIKFHAVSLGGALAISFTLAAQGAGANENIQCNNYKFHSDGKASWYGEEMAIGKKKGRLVYNPTASGDEFIPGAISAAHKTLRMGTNIRVVRLDTKESLVMEVNDRGPYAKGRILDLSRGAAEKLRIKESGEKRVAIYICKP